MNGDNIICWGGVGNGKTTVSCLVALEKAIDN